MLISTLILTVGGLFYLISTEKTGEEFTEFYLLGPNELFQSNPVRVKVNESIRFLLGIVNHEMCQIPYTVEMRVRGEGIQMVNLRSIGEGEKKEISMVYEPMNLDNNCMIEFILWKDDVKEPYRRLYFWIDIQ